jgi:hypothetical protein
LTERTISIWLFSVLHNIRKINPECKLTPATLHWQDRPIEFQPRRDVVGLGSFCDQAADRFGIEMSVFHGLSFLASQIAVLEQVGIGQRENVSLHEKLFALSFCRCGVKPSKFRILGQVRETC